VRIADTQLSEPTVVRRQAPKVKGKTPLSFLYAFRCTSPPARPFGVLCGRGEDPALLLAPFRRRLLLLDALRLQT
jgi:hypothetical protein